MYYDFILSLMAGTEQSPQTIVICILVILVWGHRRDVRQRCATS